MTKATYILSLSILILLLVSLLFTFTTCKKEKDIEAVITVKLQNDSTKVVPYALVNLYKQDVNVKGYTDASGVFRATFKLEAILDVSAQKDSLCGQTIIRLKPETTIHKTVLIHKCK